MISVKNIYKNFGALNVLKGVSCDIQNGEKVAIIGPSGSGKSTLLRCMNLLEEPSMGEVWLDEDLLTEADPYLHEEILKCSHTYQAALKKGASEEEALAKICAAQSLKKVEGPAFAKAKKEYTKAHGININTARQKMGMVFQHFNLFNNMTVLQTSFWLPFNSSCKPKRKQPKKQCLSCAASVLRTKQTYILLPFRVDKNSVLPSCARLQ